MKQMGLSSGLADAAKTLKEDINNGVDVKKAVLAFADKVEKVAKAAKAEAQRILESSSRK